MASRSKIDAFSLMWSAVALSLAGARAASVVAWAVAATPRARPLVGHLVLEVLARQLAPEALAVVVAASRVAALVDEAEVVADSVAIEAVALVTEEEEAVDSEGAVMEASAADEVASATSPTAMAVLPMALLQALEVHETADSAADAVGMEATVAIAAQEEDDTTTDEAAAVEATTVAPVAPTTNPWAAEIDHERVGMVATTAPASAATRVTAATTIAASEGGTERASVCFGMGLSGYLPFLTSSFLVNEGKISSVRLLTLDFTASYGREGKRTHSTLLDFLTHLDINTPVSHIIWI